MEKKFSYIIYINEYTTCNNFHFSYYYFIFYSK